MTMTPPPERSSALDVVVLCGGRGTRLKPLTDLVPKPMVPVHGRPMLDHIIELLSGKGLQHFILCIGYHGDVIRDHYASAGPMPWMEFSDSGEQASMLQRLMDIRPRIGERFLCVYGDTFIDINLDELMARHQELGATATIVTAKVQNPFGLVRIDEPGHVTFFEEKPLMTYYVGCLLAERSILDQVDADMLALPDGQGLVALLKKLIGQGRLAAYDHTGLQLSFNTLTEHEQVEEQLGRFYTLYEYSGSGQREKDEGNR